MKVHSEDAHGSRGKCSWRWKEDTGVVIRTVIVVNKFVMRLLSRQSFPGTSALVTVLVDIDLLILNVYCIIYVRESTACASTYFYL